MGDSESFPAPRPEIIAYEVKPLDSIFSIADDFGLLPETILWSNRYLIGDTPDGVRPGQKLIILPEDGVYHAWLYGEGMNGVSSGYGVTPQDILAEPLNDLDASEIGDLSLPHIKTGTFLYIPGGRGSIPSWVSIVTDPGTGAVQHANVSYSARMPVIRPPGSPALEISNCQTKQAHSVGMNTTHQYTTGLITMESLVIPFLRRIMA